jgi:hypothetical protein
MKKIIVGFIGAIVITTLLFVVAILLVGCAPSTSTEGTRPVDKGVYPQSEMVTNERYTPVRDIWRYVDKEYGVVIYSNSSGAMVIYPIPKQ